jgi:hypothetical protein
MGFYLGSAFVSIALGYPIRFLGGVLKELAYEAPV